MVVFDKRNNMKNIAKIMKMKKILYMAIIHIYM